MTDLVKFLLARFEDDLHTVVTGECRCVDGEPTRADCCDRIVREVEAKRQIMWRHQGDEDACADDGLPNPCPTLRLLALPYADLAEEWRPDD